MDIKAEAAEPTSAGVDTTILVDKEVEQVLELARHPQGKPLQYHSQADVLTGIVEAVKYCASGKRNDLTLTW